MGIFQGYWDFILKYIWAWKKNPVNQFLSGFSFPTKQFCDKSHCPLFEETETCSIVLISSWHLKPNEIMRLKVENLITNIWMAWWLLHEFMFYNPNLTAIQENAIRNSNGSKFSSLWQINKSDPMDEATVVVRCFRVDAVVNAGITTAVGLHGWNVSKTTPHSYTRMLQNMSWLLDPTRNDTDWYGLQLMTIYCLTAPYIFNRW